MVILDLLLSGPVLLFIAGIASLAIVVKALTDFAGQGADLRVRLSTTDQELARLRDGLPARREAVDSARAALRPLKQEHASMMSYYKQLHQLESKALKEQTESEKESSEVDIQIHRKGIPGL